MKQMIGSTATRDRLDFRVGWFTFGAANYRPKMTQNELNELVNELDTELLANHRHDGSLFEALTDLQRRSSILHDDRPICPFLRPFFLSRSRYDAVRNAARHLSTAFERLTAVALKNPVIMAELGLTEKEEKWARLEPGYECVSVNSRLDTFFGPEGFAFLEYNAENPAGIGDQASLEVLFREVPDVCRFLERNAHHFPTPHVHLLRALDETYREWGGQRQKPAIAIVDWSGVSTSAEFEILREYFTSLGYPCTICDPEELEFDGRRLRVGNFEIDIFFKRVIIHEFLDRCDESHPLYKAMAEAAVCMANSFRSKIPHKKSSFAILSDPRYERLFGDLERRMIRLHIPWTRQMRFGKTERRGDDVDLIDIVRRDRHLFVLKPNDDYGGKGITLGWESTDSEWDDAIEHALASDHIVQDRVAVEKTDIPVFGDGELRSESLLVDFDPFLFRGEVEGGMVRLSASSVVNVTQGGGETALAILEDF